MRKILFLLCIITSIQTFSLEAQPADTQEKKNLHVTGITSGINDFHLKDEYLSPHIFSGALFSSGISYQLRTKKYIHIINVGYGTGHLTSADQPRNVTEKTGLLSYSVFKLLGIKQIYGNPFEISMGAGVSSFVANTDFIARDEKYSYEWSEQSWYCSNSVNIHFRGDYNLLSGKRFYIQFSVPVFSLVARPENGHFLNSRNIEVIDNFSKVELQGKPEFFWQNIPIICKLGYSQPLGKKFNLGINYQFDYYHSERPLPLKMYTNQIQAALEFSF